MKGTDYLYVALGIGALWLIFKNTKPVSEGIIKPVSRVVAGASNTVSPLFETAAKGAEIVTNPESWKLNPMTASQYLTYSIKNEPLGMALFPGWYGFNFAREWINQGW